MKGWRPSRAAPPKRQPNEFQSSSSTPTAPEAAIDMSIWADVAWCSLLPTSIVDALGLRSDEKRKLAAIAFSRGQTLTKRNQLAMTKLGISVGILATVSCLSAGAQTINVLVLHQAGAQTVLQAAIANAAAAALSPPITAQRR